ncbi:hypothetical protein SAY87_002310 [Trapa incisa]|uniref:Cation/H(+) antiporter C-terminal domain-containing protein n=1 Tax=Trapa incisa TaxID=236973 RepID=A0AAN7JU47_9MYRT|nr:hypothetical protein SAY87_002310 [Trapa incisa]
MSENPGINLTVMRFIAGDDAMDIASVGGGAMTEQTESRVVMVSVDSEKEKMLDEEHINEFRTRNANNELIEYVEKVVNNGEETVAAIRSIDSSHDLFIVGRGKGMISPLTAGLTDWSECPELGAIGDFLASSDFAATVSVLVVQQYIGFGSHSDGISTPDSPGQSNDQVSNMEQNVRRPQQ